ncbi:hypothetical protein [Deferribacter abyssi]|uniref:hypothetical protein n=1 Tax=Deferribacter abyssi TaxID=213806 RepID=UPI003C2A28E2
MPDIITTMNWILFLALFPLSFVWLKNAYKIFIKKDFTNVAVKKGELPPNPKKWAPYVGLLNLFAGLALIWAIFGVVLFAYPYNLWTGIASVTIWFKVIGEFIIKQHAHPISFNKKKVLKG